MGGGGGEGRGGGEACGAGYAEESCGMLFIWSLHSCRLCCVLGHVSRVGRFVSGQSVPENVSCCSNGIPKSKC